MLDREQLETFATVVDVGSFDGAATLLNVTRGAVSQRIRSLEESVSKVLLLREKPVVPTDAGKVMLRHVKALRLFESETLEQVVTPNTPRAPVPVAIAVNADSLATWFPAVLWPLLRDRRIDLEVVTDGHEHTLGRLARGEVVGCLSTEPKPQPGFVSEPLGAMEYRCYANREFAARHFPRGIALQDVLCAPALLFNRKDGLHDAFLSSLFGFKVARYPRHYLPALAGLLSGVLEGVGYGLLPSVQVQALPGNGRLVDLVPDSPVLVNLYWHHWAVEPTLLQEITAGVVKEAAKSLRPFGEDCPLSLGSSPSEESRPCRDEDGNDVSWGVAS